ncbi:hypothetical protein EC968_008965 [Mortierella alpina]|nr:hypothetical protein EC968_008965 [Mortierella alpina]
MSSDMASPPIQFDSDPSLMAGNTAPGPGYGGYQNLYGNMNGSNMNFSHSGSYAVPSPATPPSLPPIHNNGTYAPNGNFQFPYQTGDATGSTAPPSTGAAVSASTAPLSTPTGAGPQQPSDGAQHSPHAQQQAQSHQLTPPQQHPQTPQQQQQQHQTLQRQAHQPVNTTTQSPYQASPQAHHPGMSNLMHTHPIYPGDGRYDSRLQQQQQQQQQRYMDPNMSAPMLGRNGSRSGDMPWTQPNGMMPDLLGANHPGAVRNMAGPQGRMPTKQGGLGGLNGMGGMSMGGMNGMGGMGLGMPGMPMSPMGGPGDRMGGWPGGMVGAPTSPYGHGPHGQQALQHQQQFHHLQQHPYQQAPHLLQHQQGLQQHLGLHGRPGMGPAPGGGISKKKSKRPVIPVVKDKNCPKRPRNSYIFFTLMKRDDIKKKHPEFKPTEITKMLGEEWQKLSESEKESYGTMAENDKKRYQTEMETYDANGGAAAAAAANEAGQIQSGGVGNGPPGPGGDLGGDHWRA